MVSRLSKTGVGSSSLLSSLLKLPQTATVVPLQAGSSLHKHQQQLLINLGLYMLVSSSSSSSRVQHGRG